RVTAGMIPLLQIRPAAGRALIATDFGRKIAMVSYEYWQRQGGRPDITSQGVVIDGEPFAIAGVLPADFFLGVNDANLIVPDLRTPGRTIARLLPGVAPETVRTELAALLPNSRAQVIPLARALRSNDSNPILLLLATSGFVLLITCANLANLQLVRGLA